MEGNNAKEVTIANQELMKMEETTFEAKLCGVADVKFPFVKAAFRAKDGNVYMGVMLIDTCSTRCVLNKSVLPYLDASQLKAGAGTTINTVGAVRSDCQEVEVELEFKMGNRVFTDTFCVNDTMDFDHMFTSFIGIIGNQFLMKHSLTLDFSAETLRSSCDFSDDDSHYEFFFPMHFGLEHYDLPVVVLGDKDHRFVMMADSGSNDTVLTKHALDEAGITLEATDETGSLTWFNAKEEGTTIGKVHLSLLSLGSKADEPKVCRYHDTIQVVHTHKYIMDNPTTPDGKSSFPISGMLSSSFMLEHKWVLDFAHGVMYSLKAA